MKRLIILLLVGFICFCGCFLNNKPVIVSETYDTPLDSLYQRCSELTGIGMFDIGMSWSSVVNSKELKLNSWDKKTNWYNGHWGVQDFDFEKWLISKHPEIKQFYVNVTTDVLSPKYALGDIEFQSLELAFLNDKLVAAYYVFDYDTNKIEIYNHYIQKYGEGQGSFYSSKWNNHLSGDDYACDITVKENRKWMNERVALEFVHDERLLSYPKKENKQGLYWNNEYYIVYDEEGYKVFENILNEAKEEYKNMKNDEHSSSLNSL